MRFRHTLWFGFLIGFLFGTVGLWVLATLSLLSQTAEALTGPLFLLGRWLGGTLARGGSLSTAGVLLLMGVNGVVYGAIGAVIQALARRRPR